MTLKVPKSILSNVSDFEAAVKKYIAALHAFSRTEGTPRPTAHPLVEGAVKRTQVKGKPDTYSPDYEIFDDTPVQEAPKEQALTLDEKKNMLAAQLQLTEAKAREKLYPPLKVRLLQLNVSEANVKRPEDRTPEEEALLAQHKHLMDAHLKINRKAAEALAAIADLTEDTIDSWQQPSFD